MFSLQVSYFEIYLDKIRDLLDGEENIWHVIYMVKYLIYIFIYVNSVDEE